MSSPNPLNFNLNIENICILINKYEPFFCYLISGIKLEIGKFEDFKYMACNSSTIFIQEEFVEIVQQNKSKLKEFTFILLHEIYHIYLHHNWRYGFNNEALFSKYKDKPYLIKLVNLVLDAIINTNLINCGYDFGSLEPTLLKSILPDDHPRINSNSWNEDDLLIEVLKNTQVEETDSGYTLTLFNDKKIKSEDINPDLILSESETDLESVQSIQEIAKKGANLFRQNNKSPGNLSSKILPPEFEETKSSNISWEDKLKNTFINSISNRVITNYSNVIEDNFYSYKLGLSDFNKCSIEFPYKPLPEPNTIAVFVDLSGSIFCNPHVLSKFLFQITEISKYVGNLLLITFDIGMTGCFLFDTAELSQPLGDLLEKEKSKYLLGGGGTDVIPLFKEFFNGFSNYNIDVNTDEICMIVVLTDLWLEQVDSSLEPYNCRGNIPTLWVVPEGDFNSSNNVNFGEILIINEK